jgi:hypothetical protein
MLAGTLAAIIQVACAEDDAMHAALARAVQRYLDGDAVGARTELQALLSLGPDLPADVRRDALLWLGDIFYAEGGVGAARNTFEALLSEAPDHTIDAYRHDPGVIALFEEVRREVQADRASIPTPPPVPVAPSPWPWRSVVPFGVGYFVEGRPAAGILVGSVQLVGLGVSIGTYVDLRQRYPGDWPDPAEFPKERAEDLTTFKTLLRVNQAAFAVGWLGYLAPIAVDTGVWARERRLSVAVGPNTVTVTGQF